MCSPKDADPIQHEDPVEKAKAIVAGPPINATDALDLVKQLKRKDAFRWGRRVLQKVDPASIGVSLRLRIGQELSLCTYKDPDRPALEALNEALRVLGGVDDLDLKTIKDLKTTKKDQETLGLAGAIHKRLWQATGRKDDLERSYQYYRYGHDSDPLEKLGYTSINAAFVLDQLASIEAREGAPTAAERREEAKAIRNVLVAKLAPLREDPARCLDCNWWYLVTVAEAFFGTGEYEKAGEWLERAKRIPGVADWELRSTAFQLATLYQLQHDFTGAPPKPESSAAARVLDTFVGSDTARKSAFVGKLGLALSGGGFRASLFHIGVLARLAELDLLRHVEVLSCVSGGSIIGAQYYLQLRELLETTDVESKSEDEIRKIYIALVDRVATDFLAGVQRNIRIRVFANPFPMLRTLVSRSYSRTVRLGELLEKELFQRVFANAPARKKSPLLLRELKINPVGTTDFDPKRHNWRRKAKVPVLVLNATTLNTAHNWQYTATFMGESPYAINTAVDGNSRLRRVYYGDAPDPHKDTTLGQAVVASACVPGLFEPIRLDGLYEHRAFAKAPEKFIVKQVDGGVHDNQGIASLFEQDCSVILVSDASGQIITNADARGGVVSPLTRSNSILMQRVRQEQFERLKGKYDGGLLKGMMFIHLKQDLDVEEVDWLGCEEPPERANPTRARESRTSYGIRKEVQTLLAGMRTDLDSFSDAEAFALMTSGYRMAEHFLPSVQVLPKVTPSPVAWPFLGIEQVMKAAPTTDRRYTRLLRLLDTGSIRLFRAFFQSKLMWLGAAVALLLLLGIALWLLWWAVPAKLSFSLSRWTLAFSVLAVGAALAALMAPKIREHVGRIGLGILAIFICIVAQAQLRIVDPIFLAMGKVTRPTDDAGSP